MRAQETKRYYTCYYLPCPYRSFADAASAHRPLSRRIKLWGNARVVQDDPTLLDSLRDSSYAGKVERAILFEIEAWDVNCPQHIHKRLSQSQVAPVIEQLQGRIAHLEAELRQAKGGQ